MPSRIRRLFFLTVSIGVLLSCIAMSSPSFALDIWTLRNCPENLGKLNIDSLGKTQTEPLKLWMAHGEWEGFFVVLRGIPETKLSISLDGKKASSLLDVETFRVGFVPVRKKQQQIVYVPDPLLPLSIEEAQHLEKDLTLFYFKLRLKNDINSRKSFQFGLQFDSQGQRNEVKLLITPVALTLTDEMPLAIQAAWSPKFARKMFPSNIDLFEENKKALALLVKYRINSFAGVYFNDPLHEYEKMVDYCINTLKVKRLRLASPTFKRVGSDKNVNLEKIENLIDNRLQLYQNLITRYPDRLSFKIWDEPHQNDFQDVARLYQYIGRKKQKISLEVSAPPVSAIKDLSDIFVVRINDYDPPLVSDAQRNGKQVWLYANPMHSLREPYYLMRNIGWLLWGWKLDGYHFWAVNNWSDNPWHEPAQKSNFFRKGVFVYPGDKKNCIFPSLRLEMFREGLEDYLALVTIERKQNQEAAAFAKDLFLKGFPFKQGERIYRNDSRAYHDQLLEIISRQEKKPKE